MNITPDTSADPQLSREDALAILNTPDESLEELVSFAETFRRKYKGNHVSIHILTNARSGNCSQDCAYCAQSCRSKADIDKYKWVADEKLYEDNDFVNEHHLSRHCIGLSGMKFTDAEIEVLAEKIRKMKADGTHLCCSIGFLTEHQAKVLKDAGLDRINHNLTAAGITIRTSAPPTPSTSAWPISACSRVLAMRSAAAASSAWENPGKMSLIC